MSKVYILGGAQTDFERNWKKEGKGMVAIFTYLLEVAARNFAEANVELHTLTDYDALIQVACEQDYVMDKELESLKTWRQNPELWSDQHMES